MFPKLHLMQMIAVVADAENTKAFLNNFLISWPQTNNIIVWRKGQQYLKWLLISSSYDYKYGGFLED